MNRLRIFIKRTIIKYKLHKGFKSGKIIVVNKQHRGIGKTILLVKMSKKYKIPIMVGYKSQENILNDRFCKFNKPFNGYKKQMAIGVGNGDFLRGTRFRNGVFVDETVNMRQIQMLIDNKIKIRTGFYYNDLLQ
ncbi:hypothetical protein [Clostridium sp. CTA-6]